MNREPPSVYTSVGQRKWVSPKGEAKSRWVARWKFRPTEVFKQRSFETEKQARAFASKLKKDPRTLEKKMGMTVNDACSRYLRVMEARYRNKEITRMYLVSCWTNYEIHIAPFIGAIDIRRLTSRPIQEWIDSLAQDRNKPRSPQVIRKTMDVLRGALTECERLELIDKNILKTVPPRMPRVNREPIQIPDVAQLGALLDNSAGDANLIIRMSALTGLRAGELFALQWKHINYVKRVIEVRQTADRWGEVHPKTKTRSGIRNVPLATTLLSTLRERMNNTKSQPNDYLFMSKKRVEIFGKKTFKATLRNSSEFGPEWRSICRKANILDENGKHYLHFHSLRHLAASLFIEQGLSPKRIQGIMGHASITMTFDHYGRLLDDAGESNRAADRIAGKIERLMEAL